MFKPYFFWNSDRKYIASIAFLVSIPVNLLQFFLFGYTLWEIFIIEINSLILPVLWISIFLTNQEKDPYYSIRVSNAIVFIAFIIGSFIFYKINESLSQLFSVFLICFTLILLYMYVLLIYRKHISIQESLSIKPPDYLLEFQDFDRLAKVRTEEENRRLFGDMLS